MSTNGENEHPCQVQVQAGSPSGSRPGRTDSMDFMTSSMSDCSVSSEEGEPTITLSSALHHPQPEPPLSAIKAAPAGPLFPAHAVLRRSFIPVPKRTQPKPAPPSSSSIPVPSGSKASLGQHLMKPPKSGLVHRSPKKRAMHEHLKSALRSSSDARDQGSSERRKQTKHRVRFQLT